MRVPTSAVSAVSLIGGFAAARYSGRRELGGMPLAAGAAVCLPRWREGGWPLAVGLTAGYLGAAGVSHPLAHRIGAWPSVLTVAAATALAAHLLADRRH